MSDRPILIAYDGSDYAKAAIKQAADQLGNGRRAIVMTVWQPYGATAAGDPGRGVLAAHPRTDFKTGIVEAFSAGMRDKPEAAFGTMNTDILEATVPGYVRPNFCDYIRDSRFDS